MSSIKTYLKKVNALKRLKLRYRIVKGGYSLYIDNCQVDNRQRWTLDIKIKDVKDKMLTYAIALRDKKELELLQDQKGFVLFRTDVLLQDYFKKKMSGANSRSVLNHIIAYKNWGNLGEISRSDCENFAEYLLKNLSSSTAKTYFILFKSCLNKAVRDQLLKSNPADTVKIKAQSKEREFLTHKEIQRLITTPCQDEEIKRAFIFGCFTGVRLGDIQRITKNDIQDNVLILRQQKTQSVVRVPLHEKALEIVDLVDRDRIFILPSVKKICKVVKDWVKDAGISKKITFHNSRHSFATLLLTFGTDIYTVSKLVGHKSIRSTEIYANLVDSKRAEAIRMLPAI